MAERAEIDEIIARTDIIATVEKYVTLKRVGSRLKGLCPFHNEKTPSFNVDPESKFWKCFGCGESGDVIKFVQKIENLTFFEALERLAALTGVTLTSTYNKNASYNKSSEPSERDRLYNVNNLALTFFVNMLSHSEIARNYLLERGIKEETQQLFRLGFAPDSWDGLVGYLTKNKVSLADAELAGLVGKSESGRYYDRLRGRVIFPIFDVQDRPIGFGGRVMGTPPNGQPKYWNSPETPVFYKSKTLYGLSRSRKSISEKGFAIVVEGYTDVVAAHQAGFTNAVATLGTALTEEHVKVLARLAPLVILSFDADSAGLKAAYRAAGIFEAQEVDVKVLELPDGEDPDSLLKAGRHEDFEKAIKNAMGMVEYRLYRMTRNKVIDNDRDRTELMRKLIPVVAAVNSAIERDRYIRSIVTYHPGYRFGASYAEEQIRHDIQQYLSAHRGYGAQLEGKAVTGPQINERKKLDAAELAERHLLRALATGDLELAGVVLNGILPEEFVTVKGRRLAEHLYYGYRESITFDLAMINSAIIDEEISAFLTDIVMADEEPLSLKMLEDDIIHIKTKSTNILFNQLKAKIDSGEANSEDYLKFAGLSAKLKGSGKNILH